MLVAMLVVAGAAARPLGAGVGGAGEKGSVAIFYYPWWGTPRLDGAWQHWAQNGNAPPAEIASNWFPTRGPYSSTDASVLRSQMREIAGVGIRTLIVSWWGPGSVEDARLGDVARMARSNGLRVAVHIEPFPGRTPASLEAQIATLARQGITDFYIYDSSATPAAEWAILNAALPGVRLFANTNLPGRAKAGGFAGLYTYDIYVFDGSSFPRMCTSARSLGLLCAPSVGPGYEASRATGDTRVRTRGDGVTYDQMWRGAVRATADIVTITSYNEWHEGTQIEPARVAGPAYDSYEGAYGLRGRPAQRAYLDRTALWVGRYHESRLRP